ncbi:hypothetical protein QBC39DRAFT_326353 [Podospora conica]|nr:hypothetical protein QBC39DRAFT_326353 [Schizothecium conicum]
MVSVASLLNPDPPRAPLPTSRPPFASPGSRRASVADDFVPTAAPLPRINSMARDVQGSLKARASGQVRFPPFEDLDEASLREIRRFQVRPSPSLIRDNARRIPYNSGKKDFSQKTNRDSFQVFQYEFRLPGDDQVYTVLWDYNIGLVRMTPFFKCCRYSKTTPAKMLNQNPGLRDITHSITGGAITAQGYWMPYDCAKAVCATFCSDIAPALIPIFGPGFPSECIPRQSPSHGRMIIDPEIIATSSRQAHMFCQLNATLSSAPTTPMLSGNDLHSPRPGYSPYRYSPDTAYGTDPNTDVDMYSPPVSASSRFQRRFLPGPNPARSTPNTSAWTPINQNHPAATTSYQPTSGGAGGYYSDPIYNSRPNSPADAGPNPWLSALPSRDGGGGGAYTHSASASTSSSSAYTNSYYPHRYPPPATAAATAAYHPALPPGRPRYDDGYDAGESMNGSNSSPERERDDEGERAGREQDAATAMVLMGLYNTERGGKGGGAASSPRRGMPPVVRGEDVPRVKRRRATLV